MFHDFLWSICLHLFPIFLCSSLLGTPKTLLMYVSPPLLFQSYFPLVSGAYPSPWAWGIHVWGGKSHVLLTEALIKSINIQVFWLPWRTAPPPRNTHTHTLCPYVPMIHRHRKGIKIWIYFWFPLSKTKKSHLREQQKSQKQHLCQDQRF